MKKLVLFGDSFANYEFYPELLDRTWGATLGKLLKLPVINYGKSGSSLTYSLIKFTEYYQSDSYDLDDIIIFVLTDVYRLWTKNMKEFVGFGGIVHHMDRLKSLTGVEKRWFEENGESALWTVLNVYDPEINYELIKILSFLQTWAAAHLNNTVIPLRGFHNDNSSEATIAIENLNSMIKPSNNFFPIINNIPFTIVSASEMHIDCQRNGWLGHPDPRINHLSPINREILALMLFDLISHKDMLKYDDSLFKKDLYYEIPNWKLKGPLLASDYI
jgi:hypothetical protein